MERDDNLLLFINDQIISPGQIFFGEEPNDSLSLGRPCGKETPIHHDAARVIISGVFFV